VFSEPESDFDQQGLLGALMPAVKCAACGMNIRNREHRVWIYATWRGQHEPLCTGCWRTICEWAARFALQQIPLSF